MSAPKKFSRHRWLVAPFCAALFLVALDYSRVRHVERLRDFDREAITASDRNWLVVPEHHSQSYAWLLETGQMLNRGEWRVRGTPLENVPYGREVHSASPYHWWLALAARADQAFTGRPLNRALEQAALWSGPVLHLLLLAAGSGYAARRFGARAGVVVAIGLAGLFPLAGEFLPGVPDDRGLAIFCAGASLLLAVAGVQGDHRALIYSGIAGGLGLWLSVGVQVPVLAATGLGALVLAGQRRRLLMAGRSGGPDPLPWDLWALAGAVTSLGAYLLEYFPDHLAMRLEANHPLYGVAWIGLGQLLRLAGGERTDAPARPLRKWIMVLVGVAGVAALPVAMQLLASPGFLVANPQTTRLTNLANGAVAPNLATWLVRDSPVLAKIATCLPFLLLAPAAWAMLRRGVEPAARRTMLFLAGSLLPGILFMCVQLQWWSLVQLGLLVVLATTPFLTSHRAWLMAAAALLPGIILLAAGACAGTGDAFTRLEIEGLVERDIAHWIADHAAGPDTVVLLPPERTAGFSYHGGLRGLGSRSWENQAGVAATLAIICATRADEAHALLRRHNITYLVLLSWDTDLDEFVRWTMPNPNDAFLTAVHRWALPPWLQPVAYRLPEIPGFEGESVAVFKVTENSDRALALSRSLEYFLEVQDETQAGAANEVLKAFPANLGALVARAQFERAHNNGAAVTEILAAIETSAASGLDRLLPWDRRASLAVVLAQTNRRQLATTQVLRCVADATEERLRSLDAGALYRLLVLSKAFAAPLPEKLHNYALTLLPEEARARL